VPPPNPERIISNGVEAWELEQVGFITAYLTGGNISQYTHPSTNSTSSSNSSLPTPDPRTSEDCLFLDVIVPETIFDSASAKKKRQDGSYVVQCSPGLPCTEVLKNGTGGAPVLVWIYGGGYVGGDKTSSGNPASLIARSLEDDKEGVVYVAMNYRLGLFVSYSIPLDFRADSPPGMASRSR
jgi:carboxylesterase type B